MKRALIAPATFGAACLVLGLVWPTAAAPSPVEMRQVPAPVAAPAQEIGEAVSLPEPAFWSYPLCEVEDASSGPLPCLWPADRVGNGVGNTFYVEPGPGGTRCFTYPNPGMNRRHGGCE